MAMFLSISLLLCAAVSLSAAKDCPSGWSVYGSNLYKFNPEKTTWSEAERACVLEGGNLASVHSIEQYNFIESLIQKSTGTKTTLTWIGGSDAAQDGIWLWSDGTKFSYTKWNKHEPSNYKDEDCLHMNFLGHWNDKTCVSKYPSVCSQRM